MPRKTAEIEKASKLFKSFTGHSAIELGKMSVPATPKTVLVIGELVAVEYETVRGVGKKQYRHDFKKHARPLLCSSVDGHLYILGGEYTFTKLGIVDKPR